MRASALGVLAALAAAGCNKNGDALVVVTVASSLQLSIANYSIAATAGTKHADIAFTETMKAKLPSALSPGQSFDFGILVPKADVGPFTISVGALDGQGATLETASGMTTTSAGSTARLTVTFGEANTDGGMGDGGDAGSCAMTCDEAGVCGGTIMSCDMMIQCRPCSIQAVEPVVGRVGDTITLEGRFGSGTMVNFAGGVSAPATLLGSTRATVTVPPNAITGPVTISVGGASGFSSTDFKVTTFALGMQGWANSYPQTDAARIVPQMAVDRALHAALAVGHEVVVVGGTANGPNGAALASFETAEINADGTLQQFVQWATTGANARLLVTPRAALNLVRTNSYVLALGGWNNGAGGTITVYGSVEHAQVNGDGSGIQTFIADTVSMVTPRYLATTKVIGDYLYVFGGFTGGSIYDASMVATATVERAPILIGGLLGAFEQVPSAMITARGGEGVEVIGSTLYVFGGLNGMGALKSVEKATINGDGSLGPFSDAGMTLDDTRAAFATIVLGGKLYLVGGVGPVVGKSMPDNVATIVASTIGPGDSLGSFNVLPFSLTRVRAAFGQGVIVGNQYYAIGGGGGQSSAFDVESASINASGDLGAFANYKNSTFAPRTAPASVVYRDHLYLFGGQTSTPLSTIESAPIAPDGSLGMFTAQTASLTTPRSGAAVAVMGGTIFVYGGGPSVNSGETFNVAQDGSLTSTGSAPAAMVNGRQSFQLVALPNTNGGGGYLYAIGGDGAVAGTDSTIERVPFDPNGFLMGTFALVPLVTMNRPHSDCSGALFGADYYLLGEYNASAVETDTSPLDTMGQLGSFSASSFAALTHPRWNATSVALGGRLYLMGGYQMMGGAPVPDPTVDRVSISITSGTLGLNFGNLAGSSLMKGRRAPVSTAVGNYVYVLDGYSNTDLSSVEQAPLK
jgi:hypothetical protein